jgi:competence protein ComEC
MTSSASLAELTLELLDWAAQSPYALVQRPDLPIWIWFTGLAGVLFLLLPRGMPGRPLGFLLMAPMLFNSPERPQQGDVLFTLLDVGQGLSCVVETAAHVLVYDTGPAYASGFNTVEAVLLPYLRSRGIAKIDQLIISNADRDHAGGVEVLDHELEITRIMAGETLDLPKVERCQAGTHWQWDGIDFRILHPHKQDRFSDSNNASCVLQVEGVAGTLLIPGDVEREAEQLLVDRYREALRADILVAPHHGSKTSSSSPFVAQVRPAFVLFSTGYRNHFGFPKAAVVERWRTTGARLHNSAEAGAIQFWLRPGQAALMPALYRENNPASWISTNSRQ